MLIRPAAVVAVEQCTLCIAILRQQRPHLGGTSQPGGPDHREEMATMLTTAQAVMQACADDDQSADPHDALDAVSEAIIRFDQTRCLGDFPLPDSFLFRLLKIRAAIYRHQDNADWIEHDRQPPVLPVRDAGPDWDRKRAARELVGALLTEIDNLGLHPQVFDQAAGIPDLSEGTTAVLLIEMRTRLQDMEHELLKDPINFDLVIRLVNGLWVSFIMFEQLDPNANLCDIKGAIGTLKETLLEAKLNPDAPPID